MSKIDLSLVKKLAEKGLIKKQTLSRVEKQVEKGILKNAADIQESLKSMKQLNEERKGFVDGFLARFGDDPEALNEVKKALDDAAKSKNPYANVGAAMEKYGSTMPNKDFSFGPQIKEIGRRGISETHNTAATEVLPWMDDKYQVTKKALVDAKEKNIPVQINTSSDLVAKEDYIASLPQGSKVRIYGLTDDPQINRVLFPGNASNLRLQKAYEKLKDAGVDVEFIRPTADDIIEAIKLKQPREKGLAFPGQSKSNDPDTFIKEALGIEGGEKEFRERLFNENLVRKDHLKPVNAMMAAPVSAGASMNPMQFLQPIAEKYQQGKEAATKALSNQLDLTKDKSESSNIQQVLNVAADPMNVIPGPVGIGLQAVEGMASMAPKQKLDPAMIEGLFKGGMIKPETYQRAMKYACGGKVQKFEEGGQVQDPMLQDKIDAAIQNTVEQAQAADVSALPEKNAPTADARYGGFLANRLGVPGYEEVQPLVPDRGLIGQDLPQRDALAPLNMEVAQEEAPAPKMIEGTTIADESEQMRSPQAAQSMQMPQMQSGNFAIPSLQAFDQMKQKIEDDALKQEARSLEQQQAMQGELNKLEQAREQYMKTQAVDPNRYWANKSTGQKVMAGIAIFLGGGGKGNQQNEVLAQLNNAINRDIEAQKENAAKSKVGFDMQNNIYSQMSNMFNNETQRMAATRSAMLSLANLELNKVASMTQSQTAKLQADYLRAQIQSEQVKAMKEFQQASRLMGGTKSADDFASKIMTQVPKDLQSKAFEELGKYKDIQSKLARVDKVLDDAFEVATVSSKIPGTDAASMRATAEASLFPIVKAIVGERMTDADARILIKPYEPKITDSVDVKNKKKRDLKAALISRIPGETSILEGFGVLEPVKQLQTFKPRK